MIISFVLFFLMIICVLLFMPEIVGALMLCAPVLIPVASMADSDKFSQKIFPRKVPYSKWIDFLECYISWAVFLIIMGGIWETLLFMVSPDFEGRDFIFNVTLLLTGFAILLQLGTNVLLFILSHHTSYGYTIITHVMLVILTLLSRYYFSNMVSAV